MKINKNTANAYIYYEKFSKRHNVYHARTTNHNHLDLNYKSF